MKHTVKAARRQGDTATAAVWVPKEKLSPRKEMLALQRQNDASDKATRAGQRAREQASC